MVFIEKEKFGGGKWKNKSPLRQQRARNGVKRVNYKTLRNILQLSITFKALNVKSEIHAIYIENNQLVVFVAENFFNALPASVVVEDSVCNEFPYRISKKIYDVVFFRNVNQQELEGMKCEAN